MVVKLVLLIDCNDYIVFFLIISYDDCVIQKSVNGVLFFVSV